MVCTEFYLILPSFTEFCYEILPSLAELGWIFRRWFPRRTLSRLQVVLIIDSDSFPFDCWSVVVRLQVCYV